MTDAPERIWRWKLTNAGGWIEYSETHPMTGPNCQEYRRADLARPKVKPLVWSDEETDKDTGMVTYVGHGAAKTYYIYDWRSVPGWGRNYFESVGTHNSLEAAKAAAQADYERRILKALE